MSRAAYILALMLLLGLTGCVQMLEHDYYSPPKAKPCEVPVILHPSNRVICYTRDEFKYRVIPVLTGEAP